MSPTLFLFLKGVGYFALSPCSRGTLINTLMVPYSLDLQQLFHWKKTKEPQDRKKKKNKKKKKQKKKKKKKKKKNKKKNKKTKQNKKKNNILHVFGMCAQQRFRSACAPVQANRNFHGAHFGPRIHYFSSWAQRRSGHEVIKLFTCSTQLSMKFSLLINKKMPTIVGVFIFISREIFMLSNVSEK